MKKILLPVFCILFLLDVVPGAQAGQPVPAAYQKADRMLAGGKYSEALQAYQAILVSPASAAVRGDVHSRIGDCYFRLQDYQNALDAYRKALQLQPKSRRAPTQYWIGFCTFLLGRDREAVEEFLKIPERYPSSGMWIGTAYYWAGRASERMGKKEQAGRFYRRAAGKGTSTQGRFALRRADAVKRAGRR